MPVDRRTRCPLAGAAPRPSRIMEIVGKLILVRHGETEWSAAGRHTGRTDVALTADGEAAARALRPALAQRHIVAAFTSPAARAERTAELAGLDAKQDPELWEWDYGAYEGRTTAEIRAGRPGWYLWRDGVPPGDPQRHPGETVEHVGARADAVLRRVRPLLADGDVALVAHGHVLRVLTARYLGLDPAAGRLFRLDTGTLSLLGTEHGEPVIRGWNIPPT